jgi:DNA-binding NarL/FixJ family response regulator
MNKQIALLEDENQSLTDGLETGADKFLENTVVFSIDNPVELTKREGDILRLIVTGQTNKQIARRLSRSERTVEYHRNRLMRKMATHNTAELVRRALVMGII